MRKIGIIGCGAIGTIVANALDNGIIRDCSLILHDVDVKAAETLKKSLQTPVEIVRSIDDMIKAKPTVIVEAASQQAVRKFIHQILAADIELIVMSVGALLDLEVKSKRLHVPSGAIGGLDAISSAALAGIDEIVLTTRKNPSTLDAANRQEKLVFEGNAQHAVLVFPKEMNVAATLALTVQPEKVKVKVISDPNVNKNLHEIRVVWKHGEMLMKFRNDSHPTNPGTSALAAWSAIDLLKELLEKNV